MKPKLTIFAGLLLAIFQFHKTICVQEKKIDCLTCDNYAELGEFPYLVSLQMGVPSIFPLVHFCSGSILSEYHILTAATCIDAVDGFKSAIKDFSVKRGLKFVFSVKAGVLDLVDTEDAEQESVVLKYYTHERWIGKPAKFYPSRDDDEKDIKPYDVAVLKLKDPLRMNKYVARIHLPEKYTDSRGLAVLPFGWNPKLPNDTNAESLRYFPRPLKSIFTRIISRIECQKLEEGIDEIITYTTKNKKKVHTTNICAIAMGDEVSLCNSDQGTPLIKRGKDEEPDEIIGITSWTIGACEVNSKNAVGVFVKVSSVLDWIKHIQSSSEVINEENKPTNIHTEL